MEQRQVTYKVLVHQEDGALWAEIPDLPGCFASGETMEELWEAVAEALGLYLSTPGATAHATVQASRRIDGTWALGVVTEEVKVLVDA